MKKETKIPERIAIVERTISEASGISISKIRSNDRSAEYVEARHAIWFVAKDYMGFGYSQIARAYGKDHTTIMHGVLRMRQNSLRGRILDGIRSKCPEVLDNKGKDEIGNISDWRF